MRGEDVANAVRSASQHVQIEHVWIWTSRPFAEVVSRLEAETGIFDGAAIKARIAEKAPANAVIDTIAAMLGPSGFARFATLDHRSVLRLQGKPTNAIRFLIGDPLTAARMTKLGIG